MEDCVWWRPGPFDTALHKKAGICVAHPLVSWQIDCVRLHDEGRVPRGPWLGTEAGDSLSPACVPPVGISATSCRKRRPSRATASAHAALQVLLSCASVSWCLIGKLLPAADRALVLGSSADDVWQALPCMYPARGERSRTRCWLTSLCVSVNAPAVCSCECVVGDRRVLVE